MANINVQVTSELMSKVSEMLDYRHTSNISQIVREALFHYHAFLFRQDATCMYTPADSDKNA